MYTPSRTTEWMCNVESGIFASGENLGSNRRNDGAGNGEVDCSIQGFPTITRRYC